MKNKYPNHGTLWEVPLNYDLGNSYIQTINTSVYGGIIYLCKIMNYISKESRVSIPIEEFNSWDLLTSPISGAGPVPRKGECIWRKLGTYPLTEIDSTMPILRQGGVDSDGEEAWFIIRNMIPQDAEGGYFFDQLEHLSFYNPITFLHSIHHRITLEWMKYLNIDYEQYLPEGVGKEHLEEMKRQVRYGTNYNEVPSEIRGKVNR